MEWCFHKLILTTLSRTTLYSNRVSVGFSLVGTRGACWQSDGPFLLHTATVLPYSGNVKTKNRARSINYLRDRCMRTFQKRIWGGGWGWGISFMHDLCDKGAGARTGLGDLLHYFTREERNWLKSIYSEKTEWEENNKIKIRRERKVGAKTGSRPMLLGEFSAQF